MTVCHPLGYKHTCCSMLLHKLVHSTGLAKITKRRDGQIHEDIIAKKLPDDDN